MRIRPFVIPIVVTVAIVCGVAWTTGPSVRRAEPQRTAPIPQLEAVAHRLPPRSISRYVGHVFTSVNVTRDVLYRPGLRLDVYEPAHDRARRRAAILWIHSGGFTVGNKTEQRAYAEDFARRGYVSVSIDYRLRPKMQWFDMAQRPYAAHDAYDDATASLAWMRAHAAEYRIDTAHIFAAGYSAGGITAQELASPPDGSRPTVAAVMSISGYGISATRPHQSPRLVFHGTHDWLVPFAFEMQSCGQARSQGDRCDLVTFVNGEHGIGFTEFPIIVDRTARFFAAITGRIH